MRSNVNSHCRGDYLVPPVLSKAFDFLDLDAVLLCMQTCTRWRKVARDHPSFSTSVILKDLAPGHYNLFVTRLSHKQRVNGPLEIKLFLRAYTVLPPNLFKVLKAVWSRVRVFHIQTSDISGPLSFLDGLASPSLHTLIIDFILPQTAPKQPVLPKDFLAGHAPKLHRFRMQDARLPRSDKALSVLGNVGQVQACAFEPDSLARIPVLFPKVYSLRIVDPIVLEPIHLTRASAFARYDMIESIIINLNVAPHWIVNLLPVLPLTTIRELTIIESPDERRPIPPEAFEMILDALPGNDLDVYISTSRDVAENFVVVADEGRLVRNLGIRDIEEFRVPPRFTIRIQGLEIRTPDWDRTCVWMSDLVSLDFLRLVFPSASVFFSLLNRPAYTRVPVAVPFIQRIKFMIEDTSVEVEPEVEFSELYRWLRAGTVEPHSPDYQHFTVQGIRAKGSAVSASGRELRVRELGADGIITLDITEEQRNDIRKGQKLLRERILNVSSA